MKKILMLISFISTIAFSQYVEDDYFIAHESITLKDSVVNSWYQGVLIDVDKAAQMIGDSIALVPGVTPPTFVDSASLAHKADTLNINTLSLFEYNLDFGANTPPPIIGEIKMNSASMLTVTTFYIHQETSLGLDITNILQQIGLQTKMIIVDRYDPDRQYSYRVLSAVDAGEYFAVNVIQEYTGNAILNSDRKVVISWHNPFVNNEFADSSGVSDSSRVSGLAYKLISDTLFLKADTITRMALVGVDSVEIDFIKNGSLQTALLNRGTVGGGFVNDFDSLSTGFIDFDTTGITPDNVKGRAFWDATNNTLSLYVNDSVTIQLAQEHVIYGINETGSTLDNFTAIYVDSCAVCELPRFRRAYNTDKEISEATLAVTTQGILNGQKGFATINGRLSVNHGLIGKTLWLGSDSTDNIVISEPTAPNYRVRLGEIQNENFVRIAVEPFTGTDTDVNIDGVLNGTTTQTQGHFDTLIGGVVYFDVFNEENTSISLPYMYSKLRYDLNTLTGSGKNGYARVALTLGTDTNTVINYIYIDHNGGNPVLAANTTGFTNDMVRLYVVGMKSLNYYNTYGFSVFRRINNAADGSTANGLFNKLLKRLRLEGSKWVSGVDYTPEIVTDAGIDSLHVSYAGGEVWQLNQQNSDAISKGSYLWLNSPWGDTVITDLNQIAVTTTGASLRANNTRYGLNLFLLQNSSGHDDIIAVTTPTGSYASDANAIADVNNYAVRSVPVQFREVAVRTFRWVVNFSTANGGTFTTLAVQDERGQPLGIGGAGGGGGGGVTTYDGLTDTPASKSGQAGKYTRVNSGATALEYAEVLEPVDSNLYTTVYQNSLKLNIADLQPALAGKADTNGLISDTITATKIIYVSPDGLNFVRYDAGGDMGFYAEGQVYLLFEVGTNEITTARQISTTANVSALNFSQSAGQNLILNKNWGGTSYLTAAIGSGGSTDLVVGNTKIIDFESDAVIINVPTCGSYWCEYQDTLLINSGSVNNGDSLNFIDDTLSWLHQTPMLRVLPNTTAYTSGSTDTVFVYTRINGDNLRIGYFDDATFTTTRTTPVFCAPIITTQQTTGEYYWIDIPTGKYSGGDYTFNLYFEKRKLK